MVAQISPGEIYGVVNSLEFAKDLVKEWLEKYKFKNWNKTSTKGENVTPEMREKRACEVADMFCDHMTWRTHGRSLKIEDLNNVLLIEKIDDDKKLSDIVYRIKTVLRLIFDSSTIYKLYFLDDFKLAKTFTVTPSGNQPTNLPFSGQDKNKSVDGVELDVNCPKCGKNHTVNGYLDINKSQIQKEKLKTNNLIVENDILICDNCQFALDLKPIKAQVENQTKRKLTF